MQEAKKELRHCPNCGEIVDNRYCPACGQENREFEATFNEMIREFFSHAFNLDSRFFKTMKYLLFHPGWLTVEYFKGRRESYISPLKLYLIISMVYFLTFTVSSFYSDISKGISYIGSEIENTESDSLSTIQEGNSLAEKDNKEDSNNETMNIFNRDMPVNTDEFTSSFINNAPKVMFFLLPLAALILKILYRRKILYFQHLIFLLHVHSFFFFTMIVFRLLHFESVFVILFIMAAVYIYIAMKKYYRQSVSKTLLKLTLFSSCYFFILAMLLIGNVIITALSII